MPDVDWPAVCVRKIRHDMGEIQVSVRVKTGVKTDNAPFQERLNIVMNVMKTVEKDF